MLVDKQLTNTWYVSQCISPPLRGIIVYGISEEKRTKCKYVIRDKNQPTVLATVITAGPGVAIYNSNSSKQTGSW